MSRFMVILNFNSRQFEKQDGCHIFKTIFAPANICMYVCMYVCLFINVPPPRSQPNLAYEALSVYMHIYDSQMINA